MGTTSASQQQPEGDYRELYSILGDNAPPLAMGTTLPKLTERRAGKSPATKWARVPFKNPARKDDLELHHWVLKAEVDSEDQPEYRFAAFNTPPNVYSYSPDEYTNLLQDEHWTREETDYLFKLCQHFDLRFIVIHDRYDFPSSSQTAPRSMEDLKARYYDCCRKLTASRPSTDETAKNVTMNSFLFDKAREVHRKTCLNTLLSRTPAQAAEEEFLYVESRRLEQNYSKIVRDREQLLRSLGGPGSGAAPPGNVITGPGGPLSASASGPKLVGAAAAAAQRASSNRAAGSAGPPSIPVDPAFDAQHNIIRLDTPGQMSLNSFGLPRSGIYSAAGPSVSLRSARMPPVKAPLIPQISASLQELGVSQRLIMPSPQNQERLEALTSALSTLLELKASVEKAEMDAEAPDRSSAVPPSAADGALERGSSAAPQLEEGSAPPTDTASLKEGTPEVSSNVKRSTSVSSATSASRPSQKKKRRR